MRILLVVLVLFDVTAGPAFAQGKVGFGNDSLHLFYWGVTPAADVVLSGQLIDSSLLPLPSGATLFASLYAGNGTSGVNLTLQTTCTLEGTGWPPPHQPPEPGLMATRSLMLPGIAGGQVDTFAVVLTSRLDSLGSPYPYPYPLGSEFYWGSSGLFTMTPGTSLTYPSIASQGGTTWAPGPLYCNWIPEPSAGSLLGIGLASLLAADRWQARRRTLRSL